MPSPRHRKTLRKLKTMQGNDNKEEAMTKDQVLERLCKLTSAVNAVEFGFFNASDCFCGQAVPSTFSANSFQFDPFILDYIEGAVSAKVLKEGGADKFSQFKALLEG